MITITSASLAINEVLEDNELDLAFKYNQTFYGLCIKLYQPKPTSCSVS